MERGAKAASKNSQIGPREKWSLFFAPLQSSNHYQAGKQCKGLGWSKTQAWVWGMALGQPWLLLEK